MRWSSNVSESIESAGSIESAVAAASAMLGQLDREQLAAQVEWLDEDVRLAERAVENVRCARDEARSRLLNELGHGEVEQLPSGRLAYVGLVAAGKAKINERALDELRDELPEDLRGRSIVKPPSITEVRKAASAKRITPAIARKLIDEPARVPGLRFRTLDIDGEGE